MDSRRFEADSMSNALKMVKRELGNDAVIVSTREVAGAFGGKKIEVIASIGQSNRSTIRSPVFPRIESENKVTVVKSTLPRGLERTSTPAAGPAQNPQLVNKSGAMSEIVLLKNEISGIRREIESLPQLNLGDQMQEIKVLIHNLMRNTQEKSDTATNDSLSNLSVRLRTAGIAESIISEILKPLSVLKPKSAKGELLEGAQIEEFYLNGAIKHLYKNIKVTGPFTFLKEQNIHCVVGPTGVGKSTSIAKLAAVAKQFGNVTLLSMDATRVGATEQLGIFAKILGCGFKVVQGAADIEDYVIQNPKVKTILIDTAGRAVKDTQTVQELNQLRKGNIPTEFHLALSANMKQRDMDENILGFRTLVLSSLIFTKLDESWGYGEIVNTSVLGRLPISYFTTGQSVPQNLEVATCERILERIFHL